MHRASGVPARSPQATEDQETAERRSVEGLRRAVVLFGRTVGLVGLFWAPVGWAMGDGFLGSVGAVAALFAGWLLLEASQAGRRTPADLATRIAIGTQITAVIAVTVEPVIGPAIALGSLIPVIVGLIYVDRRRLTFLMIASAAVGVFSTLAPTFLLYGTRGDGFLELFLPTSTLAIVYLLFQIFLWNASTRMTDMTSDLRHVVEMSRDLAETMDPADVGHQLARHLQAVSGATDCTLSTLDRERDRVETFGFYPPEFGERVEPSYDLSRFPETRRVLRDQQAVILDASDPTADVNEVAYLKSIGRRRSVMLPLVVRGESVGIVELTSTDPRAFDARRVELATLLTREAALTFDNVRLHGEIREQAFRDALTGLDNRSRFQERVQHALDRLRGRSPLHAAVLFIDLDHFKLVNDRFGHTMGDRLLQAVADRVRLSVRPGDSAARLGGDEFAILLEDLNDKSEAEAVCHRLLEVLAAPIPLGEAAPTIGASIGVALSGLGGETVDELLRNADIAMYAAKAAGRGQVVFFRTELLDLAAARSELAALLRGAEARHELQLHFQPIVELEGGAPVGVEALVRWQPEGHALHMPAEFISLAEETGEILAIGRWVLGEACRQTRVWQDRLGLPDLRVYVNLSARQFRDPGLVGVVAAALREARLQPRHLTLELTESALLTRTPETLQRITQLRRLGVRLAIDDFGTGYSSLGYLHAFKVDELKIDRSFVSGSSPRRDARVLSRAIVELGRALELDMVAEGIETETQADWFRALGCRFGQGFHFSHPLPARELERYLRRATRATRATRAARTARTAGRSAPAGEGTARATAHDTDTAANRGSRDSAPNATSRVDERDTIAVEPPALTA
ncbi:MAG TPA: EAL domain-containing protein [Candidatus Limnocylindrales bacterium]|nr:EAL domain-containing protein [Candidatus Limnocylindrales bacterium]